MRGNVSVRESISVGEMGIRGEDKTMTTQNTYMDFKRPSLRVVNTMGGFFRVIVFGPDLNRNNQFYSEMDIGRGPTKQEAIDQAKEWFDSMKDETPKEPAQ